MDQKKIGAFMKELRREKGMTQENLAEVFGVSARTVLKAVDYTNSETEKYTKRVHWLLLVGAMLWAVSQLISHTSLVGNNVASTISDVSEGAACGMIICGIIITSRYGQRIKAFKQRLLKRQ